MGSGARTGRVLAGRRHRMVMGRGCCVACVLHVLHMSCCVARADAHTHVYTHVYAHAYTHIHAHVYTYAYTYVYAYVYTHVHMAGTDHCGCIRDWRLHR